MRVFVSFCFLIQSSYAVDSVLPISIPHAMTTLEVQQRQKLTAGDLVVMEVTPFNQTPDAIPEIIQKNPKLPVEWGEGRLLWFKPYDPGTGKIRLGFTTYTPGNFEIKPMVFVKKDSSEKIFITDAKTIPFEKVEGDKKKDDIYPPQSVDIPKWMILLLSILFLMATLLTLRAIQRIRKRKALLEIKLGEIELLNPIEEFEKQRQSIDSKSYLDRGQFKPHYFALSEAFKKFVGRAYHFDAQDKTTRELSESLRELGINSLLIERWFKISEAMDIVKFTDQKPAPEEAKAISSEMSALVLSFWHASPEALEIKEAKRRENAL